MFFGIFDYIDAHRLFNPTTIDVLPIIPKEDDHSDKVRRFAPGQEKFQLLKQYLVFLKIKDLQKMQTVSKTSNEDFMQTTNGFLRPIQNLFNNLIPSKKFSDVVIDPHSIRFEVETPNRIIDIDDLSSGEKELFFVFTELYRLKLKNSIILFDEPDLHLNEEIQRKIPDILKSLGDNNQIWISTHSLGIMNNVSFDELFRVNHHQLITTSSKYTYYYAICDRDYLSDARVNEIITKSSDKIFVWSKYNIENFLINAEAIFSVASTSLSSKNAFTNPTDCLDKMRQVAIDNKKRFVNSMIQMDLLHLIRTENLRIGLDIGKDEIINRCNRFKGSINKNFDAAVISDLVDKNEKFFDKIIDNGIWKDLLNGRKLLTQFSAKYFKGISYEIFLNLLVTEIGNKEVPSEVKSVIQKIAEDHI